MVKFSIIIPIKEINHLLRQETIPQILKQTYPDFEIIIVTDKVSKEQFPKTEIIASGKDIGPAGKRDMGVKRAKGDILAFLDDDSYPETTWLKNALEIFQESEEIAAVCGPTLTPPHDNLRQKVSGYVWSTTLGSGGAGTYRCTVSPRREVDDYPTVNFLVRKKIFLQIGGFDSHFWPGEDTKLCHDLVYKLKKQIIYNPTILVYHHRRPIFKAHLEQIARYAIHRGHFARIFPRTSLRLGYFVPTLFVLGLLGGLILIHMPPLFLLFPIEKTSVASLYLSLVSLYLVLLLTTAIQVFLKEKNLKLILLLIPSIFATHIVYGILFIKGFLSPKLER